MSEEISRRKLLLAVGASLLGNQLVSLYPAMAGDNRQSTASARQLASVNSTGVEYFVPDGELVNISGEKLYIGSSIYPFRKNNDPQWLLKECKAIGFNEIRFSFPREHVERVPNSGDFDPEHFHNPYPEITANLRDSGFNVILLLNGHPGDKHGNPLDWPRNADGTIDGERAAPSFANYSRWIVNHTKDFVGTYELWNEAFGLIEDQHARKSFGPGGSRENADNYAAMMLPAMRQIKQHAPHAAVTIEGNYWNVEKSAGASQNYLRLLREADYVIRHPYGYQPKGYEGGRQQGHPGQFLEIAEYYRRINPNIRWWFTEYGVSAHDVGLPQAQMRGLVQAKGALRSTTLHLRHNIEHLDIFALYYPSSPPYSLCEKDMSRTIAWHAMQRLLNSLCLGQKSIEAKLERENELGADFRDLAVATPGGFSYLIWQETPVESFKNTIAAARTKVILKNSHSTPMRLVSAIDPITGSEPKNIQATLEARTTTGRLSLELPVSDYPLLCHIEST